MNASKQLPTLQKHQQYAFLDGTRGIAALQVLLLHYAAFFYPAFARVANDGNYALEKPLSHTPLFFLVDGYTAVYIFFLMSGFVLAQSFSSPNLTAINHALKRIIRLFIPTFTAGLIAYLLLFIFNRPSTELLRTTGSEWAASLMHVPSTLSHILTDLLLGSMVIGYDSTSIFSGISFLNAAAPAITSSANPPMWTLHAELWGSLLTLLIVLAYRTLDPRLFWLLFFACILTVGTSHYVLFLLGFAAYACRNLTHRVFGRIERYIAIPLVLAGIYVSSIQSGWIGEAFLSVLTPVTIFHASSTASANHTIAAVFILSGIALSSPIKCALSHKISLWLGKISFSIYLLHFPILFTIGPAIFLLAYPAGGYIGATGITLAVCAPLTIIFAYFFERIVDRSAIRIARLATKSEKPGTEKGVLAYRGKD